MLALNLRGGRREGLDEIPHIGDSFDRGTATWLGYAVCRCHRVNTSTNTVIDEQLWRFCSTPIRNRALR
jgi:hypothetical protein